MTESRNDRKIYDWSVFIGIGLCCLFLSGNVYGNQDVWIVDTHPASWTRPNESEFVKIRYRHLEDNRWVSSDAATFLETHSPEIPLIVFTPGYTATLSDTLQVWRTMTRKLDRGKPCRIVMWNWPSEKVQQRLIPDIRAKIPVAAANGRYMAWFLSSLPENSKVCLLGFSFGNRIMSDAVQHLGDDKPEGMRIHLVLVAPATDANSLGEGRKHGNVPKTAEKILVFYNHSDFRLHFYPHLYGPSYRTESLGKLGPPMRLISPEYRDRIEAVNLNPYVGCYHRTLMHLETPAFRHRAARYLLFDETEN